MPSEWIEKVAEDFCLSVRDGTHDSPKPVENGYYLITSRHIIGDRIDYANAYQISVEDFHQINKRSKVDQWDVLFSMIGTVGEVFLAKEEPNYAIKNIGLFKSKNETLGRWLYYYLSSPDIKEYVLTLCRGTTQAYIPLGDLRKLTVKFPSDTDQLESIIKILTALDDKIELNRKMNETLEAMAKALFKSWFVDFDPVRAKAKQRQGEPLTEADQAILASLAPDLLALFPDTFQDSDLGEIPSGWEVVPFSNVIELIGGGTPKTSVSEYWDGNIPWFSVVDAPNPTDIFVIDTEKKITQKGLDNSSTKLLEPGVTIISARGTVGKLALTAVPMAMNQSCYGVKCALGDYPYFNYFGMNQLVSILKAHAHGSVFDTITRDTFQGVQTTKPDTTLTLNAFEEIVTPLLQKVRSNLFVSSCLSKTRDSLLPKLISGELTVRDAESLVGSI